MSMKCPFCNQEIEDGSTTCPFCSKELNAEVLPETTTAEHKPVQAVAEEAAQEAVAETAELVQQPENGVEVSPQPEEPKKSKKTLVIAGLVAVAAVVAVGAALMPKKNPKDTVIDAFKGIVAEGQTNPSEEIFGWKDMNTKFSKESSEMNMELQIQDSSDETIKSLATGKIGMTAMNNVADKKMSFVLGVGMSDMNIANLELYLDDKQMIAAVPEISTKAFTLNYADDLAGQVERSPYLGQMFIDSGLDAEGFGNYLTKCNELASADNQLFDIKELWNRYKEGSKAIDDLKAAMTVEKTDKKNFTFNGKDESCNGYNVTITKDALIQFATTSKEFFLADETLKKDFISYMGLMTELQSMSYMSATEFAGKTPEEIQEEAWKSASEGIDSVIAQLKESMGDVTMVVYVTKEGNMASFDYSTTAKIEGEDIKISGTVAFAGGYNMLANVNATLNLEDSNAQKISFAIDKKGQYEKDKSLTGDLTATMDTGSGIYGIVYSGTYAVDTGDYNLSLDLQAEGSSMGKITSSGLVQNVVKGESFEIYMDSIKLESAYVTGSDEYIDLSGFYKAAPLTSTIEVPTGESFDMLAATEEDWNTVSSEIVGNVFGLMSSMY